MARSLLRRNFLRCSAAAAGLAWGGLRIFAEAGPRTAEGQAPKETAFIYGTHFYRPPNPPRDQRRAMLKTIAEKYRFNLIRVYPTWDYYNPAPERFEFDEIEEVMKYCDEFGLRVLMGIVFETAPYWLEQAHPEARFVDAKGNPQRLQGSPAQITGGWPGLCLDWEPVRQAGARFIAELVKVVAPHPSAYAYDVWNEPHIEPAWQRNIWATPQETLFCYCAQTIAEFQKWLERRYGSIERLNEAWTRRYPNWKAIDPPRALGTYADWVDWRRYIIERSTKYMHFRADTVRAHDPRHVIESHAAHHPPINALSAGGTNAWRLAEVVDVWGLSLFPPWQISSVMEGAAKFDITRSNAAGKDFWLTELQGGHANQGIWRSSQMCPSDIRLWNWLAVAAGARGIIYWAYLAEATGREASGYGLVERSGAATPRAEEAARTHGLIQQYADILKDYRPRTEVAILTDPDNALLTFAMSGDEDASTDSFQGYYQALWNLDLWADFIEPARLRRAQYKLLIVPWHLLGKKETCEQLQRFTEAGGTLILETAFGLFDERFYYNPVVPPHGLDEAFGYREKESLFVNSGTASQPLVVPGDLPVSDRIYYEPEIEFHEPIAVRLKAHTYLTPLEITSATAIATCQGQPVAARKKVGRGEVFYFGTNLGGSITAGNAGGIALLRAIIRGAVQPVVTSDKLRPRLIEGAGRGLLLVFNDTTGEQTARIKLPLQYRRATDICSRAEHPVRQNAVEVTVPIRDVTVLLVE
jgi:beta-galactosidase